MVRAIQKLGSGRITPPLGHNLGVMSGTCLLRPPFAHAPAMLAGSIHSLAGHRARAAGRAIQLAPSVLLPLVGNLILWGFGQPN